MQIRGNSWIVFLCLPRRLPRRSETKTGSRMRSRMLIWAKFNQKRTHPHPKNKNFKYFFIPFPTTTYVLSPPSPTPHFRYKSACSSNYRGACRLRLLWQVNNVIQKPLGLSQGLILLAGDCREQLVVGIAEPWLKKIRVNSWKFVDKNAKQTQIYYSPFTIHQSPTTEPWLPMKL